MLATGKAGLVALVGSVPTPGHPVRSPEASTCVAVLNTALTAAVYLARSPAGEDRTAGV